MVGKRLLTFLVFGEKSILKNDQNLSNLPIERKIPWINNKGFSRRFELNPR